MHLVKNNCYFIKVSFHFSLWVHLSAALFLFHKIFISFHCSQYAGLFLFAPGVPLTISCGYSQAVAPQVFVPGGYREAVVSPVYGGSVVTTPFCHAGSLTKSAAAYSAFIRLVGSLTDSVAAQPRHSFVLFIPCGLPD